MTLYSIECNALTGGAVGALDSYDGSLLEDGARASVTTDGVEYMYRLDATSAAAESSPSIISPDSNAGDKRWILQGVRAASLQLATGATVTELSTDGTLADDSDTAVPTEKAVKTYADSISLLSAASFAGYADRAMFQYKDTDEIYIHPGRYHHSGTAEQVVYWDSTLTYQLTGLAGDDWYYLYLDDSAIVTAGTSLLTATEFIHSTTEPTYSVAKHGWYNSNDRCIMAFRSISGSLREFFHDGVARVFYANQITDRALSDLDTASEDVTLTIPSFATVADVSFWTYAGSDSTSCYYHWKTKGQIGTAGHRIGYADYEDGRINMNDSIVFTDSNQQISVLGSIDGDHQLGVLTNGFYLPRGM